MGQRLNIVLVAEESAGIQMLRALKDSDHNLVAVLASEKKALAGGASVWATAQKMELPLLPARRVKEAGFAEELNQKKVDVLLNVHSLFIINEEVLKAPRIGAFNIHPGPLPEMAGLNAPSWAIYLGHTEHAVTVHTMEPGIDTGAIVFKKKFPIGERDTGLSVALRCIKEGIPLLNQLLDRASADPASIPRLPQDLLKRNYYSKNVPQDGIIDWQRPAREVFNFIRACDYAPFESPWGSAHFNYGGNELTVTQARLTGRASNEKPGMMQLWEDARLVVACADEWLEIRKARLDGKKADLKQLPDICNQNLKV